MILTTPCLESRIQYLPLRNGAIILMDSALEIVLNNKKVKLFILMCSVYYVFSLLCSVYIYVH